MLQFVRGPGVASAAQQQRGGRCEDATQRGKPAPTAPPRMPLTGVAGRNHGEGWQATVCAHRASSRASSRRARAPEAETRSLAGALLSWGVLRERQARLESSSARRQRCEEKGLSLTASPPPLDPIRTGGARRVSWLYWKNRPDENSLFVCGPLLLPPPPAQIAAAVYGKTARRS